MANENFVTVTVTRDNQAQDAGGGFVDGVPTTVYAGAAKLFPAMLRSSEDRDEADAGIQTVSYRYLSFPKPVSFTAPATGFLPQDVVTVAPAAATGGLTVVYRISRVWDYGRSVQVEAFRLH